GGEHHVHRGTGTDARNRRPARRGRHAHRHPAPVLRRGPDDRDHGRDARPAALVRARGRARRAAHQRVRRRADDFSDGTGGDARVARGRGVCRGPHARPACGGARSCGSPANLGMFYILLQEFIGDLKAQRTRAFLTFFAVTWGTLAVVLLLAFGEGLKRTVRDGLLGAGERIFMVYGGETSKAFAGLGQGRRIRLVEEDLELLKGAIPDIDRGSMSYGRWG